MPEMLPLAVESAYKTRMVHQLSAHAEAEHTEVRRLRARNDLVAVSRLRHSERFECNVGITR